MTLKLSHVLEHPGRIWDVLVEWSPDEIIFGGADYMEPVTNTIKTTVAWGGSRSFRVVYTWRHPILNL